MRELIKKHKNFLKYIFLSVVTSSINILLYIIFINIFNEMYVLSNSLSWIITTYIIFILNGRLIFTNSTKDFKVFNKRILKFYVLRISSLIIDTILLHFCINFIGMNYILAKVIANCGTVFNNYFISKYYIFN